MYGHSLKKSVKNFQKEYQKCYQEEYHKTRQHKKPDGDSGYDEIGERERVTVQYGRLYFIIMAVQQRQF